MIAKVDALSLGNSGFCSLKDRLWMKRCVQAMRWLQLPKCLKQQVKVEDDERECCRSHEAPRVQFAGRNVEA